MIKKFLIFILIIILFTGCSNFEEYKTSFKAFKNDCNVTLYTKDKKQAKKAFKDIKNIYLKYENILKQYESGILSKNVKSSLNQITTLSKNTKYVKFNFEIKNDMIKYFITSLANNEIYEYLKNKSISKFFINLDGDIIAGYPNNKEYFLVGISNPFDNSVIKMLKLKNNYVVTKNINDISRVNDNKNSNISVTVVTEDIKYGDFIALDILLMPTKDAIEYVEKNNIKVILCYYKNGYEKIYTNID